MCGLQTKKMLLVYHEIDISEQAQPDPETMSLTSCLSDSRKRASLQIEHNLKTESAELKVGAQKRDKRLDSKN